MTDTTTRPAATFDHLAKMTDERGLFEHAEHGERRVEHGYCTDDNARMLVVTSREADAGAAARLSRIALGFTLRAQVPNGRTRNRMDSTGRWTDRPSTDDCWGRSLWGLGVAATQHDAGYVRDLAIAGFDTGVKQRSRAPRAMAFAALGAADVLVSHPGQRAARSLLADAVRVIGGTGSAGWVWPEPRLTYANAALAEALIAAGAALERPDVLDQGLTMLEWLLDRESAQGHLSVTGTAGRGRTDAGRQFDQQPIEVAAMADACWRANTVAAHPKWARGVALAAAWFDGANDARMSMRDEVTGGGFDGLLPDGVNLNQGAESTLALISTMQRARSCMPAGT
ncbi:MAG TPA: hypothetical protein VF855_01845 [Acidimicrobiales bacterium]